MRILWDPQMTIGSKIDYRRNHAGIVTNTLYRGGNPKLEAGVFWQDRICDPNGNSLG